MHLLTLKPCQLRHLSPRAAGLSHMARCLEVATRGPLAPTSPRVRGEVDLRAEPWRSEANRVRGLVHKLRFAATPPHPDSFAAPPSSRASRRSTFTRLSSRSSRVSGETRDPCTPVSPFF